MQGAAGRHGQVIRAVRYRLGVQAPEVNHVALERLRPAYLCLLEPS